MVLLSKDVNHGYSVDNPSIMVDRSSFSPVSSIRSQSNYSSLHLTASYLVTRRKESLDKIDREPVTVEIRCSIDYLSFHSIL